MAKILILITVIAMSSFCIGLQVSSYVDYTPKSSGQLLLPTIMIISFINIFQSLKKLNIKVKDNKP